jgi:hypothetical protein
VLHAAASYTKNALPVFLIEITVGISNRQSRCESVSMMSSTMSRQIRSASDSAPNVTWTDLSKLDLAEGAPW